MITKFENYTEKEKIPLMEFLEEVKKADTYDMNGKDRKGEGKKCLYAHDYIIWLKEHGF
jgi:hypothetical protein